KTLRQMVPLTCASTDFTYRHHSLEVKAFISIFTTLLLSIDDTVQRMPEEILPDLETLPRKLGMGVIQTEKYQHPNMERFVKHFTLESPKHFGPYGCAAIVKSTLDTLMGYIIEGKYPEGITASVSSARFPRYLRIKTGNSEAFWAFLWPEYLFPEETHLKLLIPTAPDIVEVIDTVNDILSFYKESVVGSEENTYIMNCARMKGTTPVEEIRREYKRQLELINDIRKALTENEKARAVWDTFIHGYLRWHLNMDRYRLDEIGL
ncbi:hypothetical protein M422DRAFT_116187, partial [Sphaerobolus stellatus SS14]